MRRFRKAATIALGVGTAAVLLAACSSTSPKAGQSTGGTRQTGGTATWAELPSALPNYIFPFMSLAFFSVTNINQFQYLMYRPLYWFGEQRHDRRPEPLAVAGSRAGVLRTTTRPPSST